MWIHCVDTLVPCVTGLNIIISLLHQVYLCMSLANSYNNLCDMHQNTHTLTQQECTCSHTCHCILCYIILHGSVRYYRTGAVNSVLLLQVNMIFLVNIIRVLVIKLRAPHHHEPSQYRQVYYAIFVFSVCAQYPAVSMIPDSSLIHSNFY